MNFANRLLIIVELLVAIALSPIVIALVLFFRPGLADTLNRTARGLTEGPNVLTAQLIWVGVALVVFVVSIILLFLELQRSSGRRIHVPQVTDGNVAVSEDAITQCLDRTISQIADVVRVKPRVSAGKGNLIDVFIGLETNPEVNVPQKTQEVIGAAKQVMEQQMGLQVGKVQVHLDYTRKLKSPKP